jgi:hypothetical protein
MPIHMIKDVKRRYGFGKQFFMGDTPVSVAGSNDTVPFRKKGGSYLNAVRAEIARQNWDDFHSDQTWILINADRSIAKAVSEKFDMAKSLDAAFDDLWVFASGARNYEKDQATGIEKDLTDAYRYAAELAYGMDVYLDTFRRATPRVDENVVIFSDFHMTAFQSLPDYFQEFNYELYQEVLDFYAKTDFCLIENGDVEDCLVFEPDTAEAQNRRNAAPKGAFGDVQYPIDIGDPKWSDFLTLRYDKRKDLQDAIIGRFPEYYKRVQKFVSRGKYVRLAGNHDTYLQDPWEDLLRKRIRDELDPKGTYRFDVYDAVQLKRGDDIRYLITHGHQFDDACMQHGTIAYAKSLGEI